MAKKPANGNGKGFEETLWDSANKLRGSVESGEYRHVVLSLIFLKFASDKFEERRQELINEGKGDYLDMVEFYTMKNVFYLPEESRWSYIQQHAKQDDIAVKIDTALFTVEKNNKALQGALPDNYFSRLQLDVSKLAALIDTINNIDTVEDKEEDVVGRVYEYFLGKFAASEGKKGGEFYTPSCIVRLIAEMIEPYKGKIYDPCCGSGGMFVQSMKFVESHHGNKKDIRNIAGNLGDVPADTFFNDQHKDLKADYIMANPPFNQKQWRGEDELTDDPRWAGYEVPPTGNANYAWIMHMISKHPENGVAGFVLANGSMSTSTKGEGEGDKSGTPSLLAPLSNKAPSLVSLPAGEKNLGEGNKSGTPSPLAPLPQGEGNQAKVPLPLGEAGVRVNTLRDRRGEVLFIDARQKGELVDRVHRELSDDDIAEIAGTYHAWRSQNGECRTQNEDSPDHQSSIINQSYQDIPGFCKSTTLDDIKSHHYVLTPGRYVGAAAIEDDGIPFEEKMAELTSTLYKQMKESAELDATIKANLAQLGFEEPRDR